MKQNEKEYSYMLRFRKDLPLDSQALRKIAEFCSLTRMNKRDAMVFLLATANVPAVIDKMLSVTGRPDAPEAEVRTDQPQTDSVRTNESVTMQEKEKMQVLHHAVKKEKREEPSEKTVPEEVRIKPERVELEKIPEHPEDETMDVDDTGVDDMDVHQDAEEILSAGNNFLDDIFNNF